MRSSSKLYLNTLLSQTSSKASKRTTGARIRGDRLYSSSISASTSTSVSRYQSRLASTSSISHSGQTLKYFHQLRSQRQDRKSYSTEASSSSGSLAKVPHRSIIEFKGRDTLKLLQGLISNDVRIFEKGIKEEQDGSKGLYAVFLHPNGRMVADVYLYQHPSPSESSTPSTSSAHLLMECDSRALPSLSAFIKKFKLRSKVSIKDVTQDWQVYQVWGSEHETVNSDQDTFVSLKGDLESKGNDGDHLVVIRDVRSPAMGRRVLVPSGSELTSRTHTTTSSDSYTAHRIMQGVPEGPLDFVESSSLPLEMSCDYMNGIDFRKGCYVGQELTARTHHTGVVRKRVVPIVFYKEGESAPNSLSYSPEFSHELPPSGTEIRSFPISTPSSSASESTSSPKKPSRGKAAGKFSSGIGNVGLACLRLEQVKRWSDPSSSSNVENGLGMSVQTEEGKTFFVRPFLPSWWPKEIEEEGVREERGDQYGEGVSE